MQESLSIIIFGAAGDLALRKLLPSLYRLYQQQKLNNCLIIGVGKPALSPEEWHHRLREHLDKNNEHLASFLSRCFFIPLVFNDVHDYEELTKFLTQHEFANARRLVYCATSSLYFEAITRHSRETGILQKQSSATKNWHRIAYEKPFGHDYASAQKINACIQELLDEQQVFRIDHFLGKSLIDSIAVFRFTNRIFAAIWDHTNIESIVLYLNETIDIAGRGSFYDANGALRDVVQNHMLQMLALIAMEPPQHLSGAFIQAAKAAILEQTSFVAGVLGQYNNYQHEQHVNPQSTTETFAALVLNINSPRWHGVPFYLQTGKCLDERNTSIVVTFKKVKCLMKECPSTTDQFILRITPESIFELRMNTKKSGETTETMPITLSYCYSCVLPYSPLAYEKIFEEIFAGEQSISVRFDEINAAWKLIDTIYAQNLPLYTYQKGSSGPAAVDELKKNYHIQ